MALTDWSDARIGVAIATRDRPEGCGRVVAGVLEQALSPTQHLQVVVVDNGTDPAVLGLPGDRRVRVVHEPQAGIPFARNRALSEVIAHVDVVAFIDDDEEPADDRWLSRLVVGLRDHDADVATGPVEPVFDEGVPRAVRNHPVFSRRRYPDGRHLTVAYTHNVAVRSSVLKQMDHWFDERLRHTGGSDTELFQRLHSYGGRIVWVADAVVREHVPAERATLHWIVRRSMRIGSNRVDRLRLRERGIPRFTTGFVLLSGAVAELLVGLVLSVVIVLGLRGWSYRGFGRAARAVGTLRAMAGRTAHPYAP